MSTFTRDYEHFCHNLTIQFSKYPLGIHATKTRHECPFLKRKETCKQLGCRRTQWLQCVGEWEKRPGWGWVGKVSQFISNSKGREGHHLYHYGSKKWFLYDSKKWLLQRSQLRLRIPNLKIQNLPKSRPSRVYVWHLPLVLCHSQSTEYWLFNIV